MLITSNICYIKNISKYNGLLIKIFTFTFLKYLLKNKFIIQKINLIKNLKKIKC